MIKASIHRFTFVLSVFLCISFSTAVNAQSVSEFTDVDSLQVGDIFNYSITFNHSEEYDKIDFPDSTDFGENLEIRSRKQFNLSSYKDSISYDIQFFGTADTTIPQLPVLVIQEQDTLAHYTNPVPIHFKSVLAEDDQSLRPLKPIFDFAQNWWPYILGFLVFLAAGYYFYQYYWKRQETKEPKEPKTFSPTPFVNPLKELQKSIRNLEQSNLSSREDFEEFYIELGDAIRRYFENLYNIPALESTSREILAMLRKRAIDEDLIGDTRAVLQEADMVKFAQFTPTNDQADLALKKANNFLKRAREVDGPRVEHLRRKHHSEIEEKRERFNQEQKEVNV